jgi:hypothetical protein
MAVMALLHERSIPLVDVNAKVGQALIDRGWMCRIPIEGYGDRAYLTKEGWRVYERTRDGLPLRDKLPKVQVGVRLGDAAMAALERGVAVHGTQGAAIEVALVGAFPEPVVAPKRRRVNS